MTKSFLHDKMVREFKEHSIVSRDDLLKFFRKHEPKLNEATFAWRVFDLRRRNIISDLKKGVYTLINKKTLEPSFNDEILRIGKLMEGQYNPYFYNIWDTILLNGFTELQTVSSLIVLEVEKGKMDSVFYSLKNDGFTEIFIKPDENMVERYVSEAKHPVIVKPFISRSPLQLTEEVLVMTPTLEKILVDLYCDDSIYFAFQGYQLENIYRIAAAEYALNFSTLFTYAKRRHRKDEIKNLLLKVSDENLKKVIK